MFRFLSWVFLVLAGLALGAVVIPLESDEALKMVGWCGLLATTFRLIDWVLDRYVGSSLEW